ncbi:Hypothetical predicted protein [Podarcis lilfordi]|uniref:Uncharacterized protein n=1 Tax=Podarcis lilfordi TaxID=74358 RepID=A0AA35K1N4_9SAUR|nr:Hypothetical predicted protein [Podarcis lilfordi]
MVICLRAPGIPPKMAFETNSINIRITGRDEVTSCNKPERSGRLLMVILAFEAAAVLKSLQSGGNFCRQSQDDLAAAAAPAAANAQRSKWDAESQMSSGGLQAKGCTELLQARRPPH